MTPEELFELAFGAYDHRPNVPVRDTVEYLVETYPELTDGEFWTVVRLFDAIRVYDRQLAAAWN